MNKLKNSKIILVLSVLLLFLVIGSASAVDETGNETISTPENNGVDTLSQSVDDGVSAAESTDDLVANDTNSNLLGLSNDDVLSEDIKNFTDLNNEIINGGSSIILSGDYYQYNSADGSNYAIDVTNKIIDGNGATIDGSNKAYPFKSSGSSTFKNINFINVKTTANYESTYQGGPIIFSSGSNNVTFDNCNFTKLTSTINAAGAIGIPRGNNIAIKNCNFYNNNVYNTLIIFYNSDYENQNITIEKCTFNNIVSTKANGIMYFTGVNNFTLKDCEFNSNTPKNGLVYLGTSNTVNIDNCTFNNTLGSAGRALRFVTANNVNITNCKFQTMTSNSNGGAISFDTCSNVNVSHCYFDNCNVTGNSATSCGGAIYVNGVNSTIEYCNFSNCRAYCGGAIEYLIKDGKIINCNFINNVARLSAGSIRFKPGSDNITMKNCNYINNIAGTGTTGNGGALEYYAINSLIDNCSFINCELKSKQGPADGKGGAINLINGAHDVLIKNSVFINNTNKNGYGGAIGTVSTNNVNTYIEDCIFEGNYAINGGAVYFIAKDSYLKNSNFTKNKATNGGAIFFDAQSCSLDNCSFINNNATTNGGAVQFQGTNCQMNNSILIGNTAKEGGAVKFNAQNSYMGYCTYINNTATQDGGALCSHATGSIVELCDFENNTAPTGKDFYGHNMPIEFRGMSFTSLWLINSNHTNKDQIVKYGYGTDASTPAIWDENALGFLKKNVHCTIYLVDTINNLTQEVLNVSDLEIVGYDPVWNKNSSGVVDLSGWNRTGFTVNASDVKFTNLTFKNANISGNGGALRIINDAAVIDNCTFMNNTACNGSAISFEKGVVLIIRDSTFINNTALGNGTVYMYDDANSTMTFNSNFMDNTAYLGSAIYYAGPVWYYADLLTLTRLNQTTSNNDTYNDTLPYWDNNTKIFTGFNESYMLRAKLCLMDVYVNLAGYTGVHNGTRDDPTDIAMAFQMVAPTGTIYFVNSSEIWNMSELYSSSESVNYKFGITFEGNNTTSTDYKFINSVYGYDVTMSDFHIINTDTCVEWKARNGTIINSSFTSKDHVAFNLTGENLTICDSSFTGNGNGALYVDASGLVLSNCTFNNNNISSGVGSHIVLTENANNTRIIDSRFIKGNNTGVLVNATGVSISGSNFTDNTGINGGALILSNGTLVLSDNNFTRNIVSGNGGALLLSKGTLSMSDNNFTYNKADVDGGAVYLENGTLEDALDNDFWHNRAGNNGGALYTNIPVVMDDGVFFNNTADVCGGGIYLNNTNNTLSNMKFSNNTAVNGSAIYVTENNTLNVTNVVLKGNTHTNFTNIDTTVTHGSIYLSNYLSEGLFKDSGLVLGDLQDIWDGTYRLPVIYVNSTGTSSTGGASPETATSLDNALDHLIDGGKIIFTTDYTVEDMVNLTNRTLTLTSNNASSIRKGSDGKYLFINLK